MQQIINNIIKIDTNYTITAGELSGKVILVTGANKGFGRAMSLDLAKAGATVILLGRDLAGLEEVYDEIVNFNYNEPILYPLDLEGAEPKHYEEMAIRIMDEFGKLDGIVHNASILGTMMSIAEYDIKIWYSVMQINLNAQFMLTQFLIPALVKSEDARVIFLSSTVGRMGRAYWGAYSVSKFATEGMAKALSEELEHTNIKVNTLNPNKMRTKMRQDAYPAENRDELPTPEEKSPAIVYLFSEDAKKYNGEMLEL
jgi:NAD(P)-dependent dehydrogenase (short-subunit alcohol dehydrogenase family)